MFLLFNLWSAGHIVSLHKKYWTGMLRTWTGVIIASLHFRRWGSINCTIVTSKLWGWAIAWSCSSVVSPTTAYRTNIPFCPISPCTINLNIYDLLPKIYLLLMTNHNDVHTKWQTRCLPWIEVDDVVVAVNGLGDVVVDVLIDVVEVGMGFLAEEM